MKDPPGVSQQKAGTLNMCYRPTVLPVKWPLHLWWQAISVSGLPQQM